MDIVYHSSNSFVGITGVSILSLLENNKNTDTIRIYYINRDITDENKSILRNMVEQYDRSIEFIDMPNWNEKYNVNLSTSLKRWPGYGVNRLFISELLPKNIDRVLYLDSDTVVEGSLEELWNLDFEDCYEAAVDDCLSKKYRKLVHLKGEGVYCNNGVLLLNLKKFREENIIKTFIDFVKKYDGYFVFNEQTILNSVFENKIKVLPLKYNVYTLVYAFDYKQLMRLRKPYKYCYSEEEYVSARSNPCITHYTGCFMVNKRPWVQGSEHPHVDAYLKYKKLSPWAADDLWEDNRSVTDKICEKILKTLPKNMVVSIASFVYTDLRIIMFEIRKRKHLNAIKKR